MVATIGTPTLYEGVSVFPQTGSFPYAHTAGNGLLVIWHYRTNSSYTSTTPTGTFGGSQMDLVYSAVMRGFPGHGCAVFHLADPGTTTDNVTFTPDASVRDAGILAWAFPITGYDTINVVGNENHTEDLYWNNGETLSIAFTPQDANSLAISLFCHKADAWSDFNYNTAGITELGFQEVAPSSAPRAPAGNVGYLVTNTVGTVTHQGQGTFVSGQGDYSAGFIFELLPGTSTATGNVDQTFPMPQSSGTTTRPTVDSASTTTITEPGAVTLVATESHTTLEDYHLLVLVRCNVTRDADIFDLSCDFGSQSVPLLDTQIVNGVPAIGFKAFFLENPVVATDTITLTAISNVVAIDGLVAYCLNVRNVNIGDLLGSTAKSNDDVQGTGENIGVVITPENKDSLILALFGQDGANWSDFNFTTPGMTKVGYAEVTNADFSFTNNFIPPTIPDDTWVIIDADPDTLPTRVGNGYSDDNAAGRVRTLDHNDFAPQFVSGHTNQTLVYDLDPLCADGDNVLVRSTGQTLTKTFQCNRNLNRIWFLGLDIDLYGDAFYTNEGTNCSGATQTDFNYMRSPGQSVFYCRASEQFVIEGCKVQCRGIATDIYQQRSHSVGDASLLENLQVFMLNSAFFDWGGATCGLHGDAFHSAGNAAKYWICENVFFRGAYTFSVTHVSTESTYALERAFFRRVHYEQAPAGTNLSDDSNDGVKVGSFILIASLADEPNWPDHYFETMEHPWGAYQYGYPSFEGTRTPPGNPGIGANAVPMIFDTDFGGDVDDTGALAVLLRGQQDGKVDLKAIICGTWEYNSVMAADAICTWYGYPDIPIARQSAGVNSSPSADNYVNEIADNFTWTASSQTADPSETVLASVFAAADDDSIVYVITGLWKEIYKYVVTDGNAATFNAKVKRVHVMGGKYPTTTDGAEYNFNASGSGVVRDTLAQITVPVIFNGYEIGAPSSGYEVAGNLDGIDRSTNPVAAAYGYWFQNPPAWVNGGVAQDNIEDYASWDIVAAFGAIFYDSLDNYFTLVEGTNTVSADGSTTWTTGTGTDRYYLAELMNAATFAADVLEPLLLPSSQPITSWSLRSTDTLTQNILAPNEAIGNNYVSEIVPNIIVGPTDGTVTGGDGSTGILTRHTTSEGLLIDVANGWRQFQPPPELGGTHALVSTPAHPNPDRTNVIYYHWDRSIPEFATGNRMELNWPRDPSGELHPLDRNGEQFYYALGIWLTADFPPPDQDGDDRNRPAYMQITQAGDGGYLGNSHSFFYRQDGSFAMSTTNDTQRITFPWDVGPAPKEEWIYFVWRVRWSTSTSGNGTWWFKRQIDPGFRVGASYSGRKNLRGSGIKYKLGVYVGDSHGAPIDFYTTNLVQASGFAAAVKECFGLTVVPG